MESISWSVVPPARLEPPQSSPCLNVTSPMPFYQTSAEIIGDLGIIKVAWIAGESPFLVSATKIVAVSPQFMIKNLFFNVFFNNFEVRIHFKQQTVVFRPSCP